MLRQGRRSACRAASFPVHFDSGATEVPLYDRAPLGAGDRIAGPAIISQLDATTAGAARLDRRRPSLRRDRFDGLFLPAPQR